jgi:hypothetical protein
VRTYGGSRTAARGLPAADTGSGSQLSHVVARSTGRFRRVGKNADRPGARDAALEVVQHIDPGRQFAIEGCHPDPEFPIQAGVGALPLIKSVLVAASDVVQSDEDLIFGLLSERRKGAVPALATEGDPPSNGPPRAALW